MPIITTHNCKSYIAYLYKVRYKKEAPIELLDSWAQMSQSEIDFHLDALYQKWQLKAYEIQGYEAAFTKLQHNNTTSPPSSATYTKQPKVQPNIHSKTPAVRQKSKSNITWYAIAGLGIGLMAIFYINYNKNNPDLVESSLGDTTLVNTINKKDTATTVVRTLTANEKIQSQQIAAFVQGENNRNLSTILQSLSPNMEQFKSISYPSTDEIKQYYEALWQEYTSSGNTQPKVVKLADKVYQLNTLLQLKTDSASKSSSMQIKQKITFNDENYIIKIERM